MKIFNRTETWSEKVNFVDDNNVVLGYDLSQRCCETADWFIADVPTETPMQRADTPDGTPEELFGWNFDPIYFREVSGSSEFDEGAWQSSASSTAAPKSSCISSTAITATTATASSSRSAMGRLSAKALCNLSQPTTHPQMSHVESVNVQITDLEALKAACKREGVEFIENRSSYKWYGRSVGDTALPAGFTAANLGQCEHVIRVPGVEYEIGVTRARNPDGTVAKGYTCLYDFWGPGAGLQKKFGKGLTKLVDSYSLEALKAQARRKGYMTQEKAAADGKIKLTVTGF